MPRLAPRLCARHARGEREDAIPGIAVRPPEGSASCSLCRQEAAEARDTLTRMTSGTQTVEHTVSTDEPDDTYKPKSARVAAILTARERFEKEEAKRVAPAVAKMDAERPSLIELDHSKPGPERQRAYDRYVRVVTGSRRSRGSDVRIVVEDNGSDFDEAMASAQTTREAILANVDLAGNDFKIEGAA
jgi:hypothetical protein